MGKAKNKITAWCLVMTMDEENEQEISVLAESNSWTY